MELIGSIFIIILKAGPDLLPVDSEGRLIYDNVPPIETWKVRWKYLTFNVMKNVIIISDANINLIS